MAQIVIQDVLRGVHFDTEATSQLVDEHGYNLTWEKSQFCPCRNKDTGQPNFNCGLCSGRGYLYFDTKCIRGIVTSLAASKAMKEAYVMGDWILGRASLTIKAEDAVSFRDRVTNNESLIRFAELFNFKVTTLSYPQRYPVVEVLIMRTIEETFVFGTDFTVDDDGVIQFLSTSTILPPADTPVSVLYTCHPTWIVMEHLHIIRDVQVEAAAVGEEVVKLSPFRLATATMPRQMVIELDYLVGVKPIS